MRIAFISSIFLALMVGFSSVIHAAPSVEATEPVVAAQVASDAQVVTINLNTADEATLQRELSVLVLLKPRRSWLTARLTVTSRQPMSCLRSKG